MKIREILTQTAEKISHRWPETPFLDSQVLMQEAAAMTKEKLLAAYNTDIQDDVLMVFSRMTEMRLSGFPVAYITGKKEFFSRIYHVDKSVLIPRPDTEILAETALDAARTIKKGIASPVKILDLCTGSGCIAITLKCELGEEADITATDISQEAEKTFYKNSEKILGYRLGFTRSNLLEAVSGKYHIIVSNPPYLEDSHVDSMVSDDWPEPEIALRGGTDGLLLIRKIAETSHRNLEAGGMLCMEADPGQMDKIAVLLKTNRFNSIAVTKDLAGRERVISGWLN